MVDITNIENLLNEQESSYDCFPLKKETYDIIGICMEVYNTLGVGFSEVVYKDAIEEEFKQKGTAYERKKNFKVDYKGIILKHSYTADFVVFDKILLEIKARNSEVIETFYQQTLNYLAVSKLNVGLIINFTAPSLGFKRLLPRSRINQNSH